MTENFKPSILPVQTIIEMDRDLYIRDGDGIWKLMDVGCGCCTNAVKVADDGCVDTMNDLRGLTTKEKSDDYFKDFKIISYPVAMVEYLAEAMSWEEGQYTKEFWVSMAIADVQKEQNDDIR